MNIKTLLNKQVLNTSKHQADFQTIIKSGLTGKDFEKEILDVKKRLRVFSENMVTDNLSLGTDWLNGKD